MHDETAHRRVALITGGGGAIGAASAVALAERGVAVAIVDIDAERAESALAAVADAGGVGHVVLADLTIDGAVEAAIDESVAALGPIAILVNALGEHLGLSGPLELSDDDQWEALYRINLLHVMRASRAVIPSMKQHGWGRIINFSSVEGIRAMPTSPAYAAFNAGVDAFTKSLAVDLARSGICVNAIAVDKTRSFQTRFYSYLEPQSEMIPGWIPAGRLGEASDIAPIVSFLASDDAAWVVGHTLVADGGTLAAGGWHRVGSAWSNTPPFAG